MACTQNRVAVNYTKVFRNNALPFIQAAYESVNEFLIAIKSSICFCVTPLEYDDGKDQYCLNKDVSIDDLLIEPTMFLVSDYSYILNLSITFNDTYSRGTQLQKAMPQILKEIRTIYKYDRDGTVTGDTIESFIRNKFQERVASDNLFGDRFYITLTTLNIDSDFIDDEFPYHYATFNLIFRIEDDEELRVGGSAYKQVANKYH